MQFDAKDMGYVAKGRVSERAKQKTFYVSLVAVLLMGGGVLGSLYYGQGLLGTVVAGIGFFIYYFYFGAIEKKTKVLTTQLVSQWNSEVAKNRAETK